MKKLSDYTGKEAIELWADIFEPLSVILNDSDMKDDMTKKSISLMEEAKVVMKKYPNEIYEIIKRIDPEGDINGANVFTKVAVLLAELRYGDRVSAFFSSAEQEISENESSGSATENTEDGVK